MDITVLSAWGEFLGGIAVVVSLIFVGIQVRNSTKASRAATRQAIADSFMTAAAAVVEPVTLNEAMAELESGKILENLPQTQRYQLQIYSAMYIRALDNAFYQYQSGLLENAQWQSMRNGLVFNLQTESGKQWLMPLLESMLNSIVDPEFAEELRLALRVADEESDAGVT